MINIFSVQEDLEESGWGLLSDVYVNLTTPIQMVCPNGHEQEQTYEGWRKTKICETCLAGEKKKRLKENKVPKKKKGSYRILALDAATNISGYSIYDNGVLASFGIFKTTPTANTTTRINEFKHWLIEAIEEWRPDFVGVENIQLQRNTEMYRVLANLQGVIVDTLYELNIEHELCYSAQWRKVCGIGGSERESKKKAAQDKVAKWYNIKCNQDEADAICIGKYFAQQKDNKLQEGFWG